MLRGPGSPGDKKVCGFTTFKRDNRLQSVDLSDLVVREWCLPHMKYSIALLVNLYLF